MAEKDRYYGLVKWQKAMTWVIVAAFVVSILAYVIDRGVGVIFYAASVIILILSGPVRLVWISFYFRREGDRKYQYYAIIVLLIIALTALMKVMH